MPAAKTLDEAIKALLDWNDEALSYTTEALDSLPGLIQDIKEARVRSLAAAYIHAGKKETHARS